jgi:hypothetical protein
MLYYCTAGKRLGMIRTLGVIMASVAVVSAPSLATPAPQLLPYKEGVPCRGSGIEIGANVPINRGDDGAYLDNMFTIPVDDGVGAWIFENKEHRYWISVASESSRPIVGRLLADAGAARPAAAVYAAKPMEGTEAAFSAKMMRALVAKNVVQPCFEGWERRL